MLPPPTSAIGGTHRSARWIRSDDAIGRRQEAEGSSEERSAGRGRKTTRTKNDESELAFSTLPRGGRRAWGKRGEWAELALGIFFYTPQPCSAYADELAGLRGAASYPDASPGAVSERNVMERREF